MAIDITTIPFLALYAETHFKFFRLFPSFLFQKQPEIVFDMPKRIAPERDIPIMLICNDIDHYPIDITNVKITISQNRSSRIVFDETDISDYLINHPYKTQSSVFLFFLSHYLLEPGSFSVNCLLTYKKPGSDKEKTVLNDNLRTSLKYALTGFLAEEHYPGYEWCTYGDLHIHSHYSRSHVEFGPPIKILDIIAAACGLSFIGITDHSYDLACTMEDYLKTDPQLSLWKSIRTDILSPKHPYRTTVILGEEISTCNAQNRIVHLGALGIKEYIPGSKDGARKQVNKEAKEPAIPEAVELIGKQEGVSFAAHPGARNKILHKIFLKRGVWSAADIHPRLHAFQAANNGFTSSWYRARKLWIEMLLAQRKLPLIAGNDAHGDFNRYRSVGIPFLTIAENFKRYLSFVRTGIYTKDFSEKSVLAAILNGKTFITNGPFLTMTSTGAAEDSIISHEELPVEGITIHLIGIGSPEFGIPRVLRVFRGLYHEKKEILLATFTYDKIQFRVTEEICPDATQGPGYIRASLICIKDDGGQSRAVTSPCYLK